MKLKRSQAFDKILSAGRAPFGITFKKISGEIVNRTGCMHMSNPINPDVTKPGTGIRAGISYLDAYNNYNSLLYYDLVKNSFRKTLISNIISINVDGQEYSITD